MILRKTTILAFWNLVASLSHANTLTIIACELINFASSQLQFNLIIFIVRTKVRVTRYCPVVLAKDKGILVGP